MAIGVYVASFDPQRILTPDPPPVVVDPPAPSPAEFVLSTVGPRQTYAGHDLYFLVVGTRAPGNPENTYIAVKNAPAGVSYSLPDLERTCCGNFTWRTDDALQTSVRLGVPARLPPGSYSADVEIKNCKLLQTIKYPFKVLPPPQIAERPKTPLPKVPGLAQYNQQMIAKGRAQLGNRELARISHSAGG